MTETQTLDKDAFARLVTQEHLQVEGPIRGHFYTGKQGKDGWELYKTADGSRYFWNYRQVCTQDNVAGGNLVVRITPATGTCIQGFMGELIASGNRAGYTAVFNGATNRIGYISQVGAVAACTPVFACASGGSTVSGASQETLCKAVASPNYLIGQITAAAQTETATLTFWCEIVGGSTAPAVSWALSGGTPNAAAATLNTVTTVVPE